MLNLISNPPYAGHAGQLPEGWRLHTFPHLAPQITCAQHAGQPVLRLAGGGNPDCCGWIATRVHLERGRTYQLEVRLTGSPGLDPMQHLLFSYYGDDKDNDGPINGGIFHFERSGGEIIGRDKFALPGSGPTSGEVRICYRYGADEFACISQMLLTETEPIPSRWIKVGCTRGRGELAAWEAVAEAAAQARVDLLLLPEALAGLTAQPEEGPAVQMLRGSASRHRMLVCGGILLWDAARQRTYNTAFLFDRHGGLIGRYDKHHPFSPEVINEGITPGLEIPVWDTEYGRIGIIICADAWFGDVTELLALKGAELILFPSAGYYRSLMPARASDNCVRIVASALNVDSGVWDTSGADVERPDLDETRYAGPAQTFRNVESRMIGEIKLTTVELDLAQSPLPHNWGGPMLSAPGGYRNRRDQQRLLYAEIEQEVRRWWGTGRITHK